jgi:hypothetical protein
MQLQYMVKYFLFYRTQGGYTVFISKELNQASNCNLLKKKQKKTFYYFSIFKCLILIYIHILYVFFK